MKAYLNQITGLETAIKSMFISKRHLTRELELEIEDVCETVLNRDGGLFAHKVDDNTYKSINKKINDDDTAFSTNKENRIYSSETYNKFIKWMDSITNIGSKHITLLRFVELHFSVYGLHRAGQDDWDSHAKRFENKIVRESTRLATFDGTEKSDYYADKILTMDEVLKSLGIDLLNEININGTKYVRATNGYIKKGLENDNDVKRGLYMESIPSNFIFSCNLTEFAHVYKMRNKLGTANPEVKECCEQCTDGLIKAGYGKWFNRDLLQNIPN